MWSVVVIFALLCSLSNATSGVLQRRAAGTPEPSDLFSRHFMQSLIKNRLWLLGEALDILGFLLQAAALSFGSLTLVEPLLTTNLIFTLLILAWRFRVPMKLREWGGGLLICLGLSFLLLAASPRGGHVQFNGPDWLLTSCAIGAFVLTGALVVRRLSQPVWRAAVAGVAAGASFALTAAFTKLATEQLKLGIPNLLSSWEVYALIASGIVSLFVMQSAYGAGPLAISTPGMQIFDPVLSVVIGLLLFGDFVNFSPGAIAIEIICALGIVAGVITLGSSARIQQHSGL